MSPASRCITRRWSPPDVLLGRQGGSVPYRILHRFWMECCGFVGRRQATTVRVAGGEPGMECQLDFGELGIMLDSATGRRRKVHALVLTAVYSRHMFVWLTHSLTLEAVIAKCEVTWTFAERYVTSYGDIRYRLTTPIGTQDLDNLPAGPRCGPSGSGRFASASKSQPDPDRLAVRRR